ARAPGMERYATRFRGAADPAPALGQRRIADPAEAAARARAAAVEAGPTDRGVAAHPLPRVDRGREHRAARSPVLALRAGVAKFLVPARFAALFRTLRARARAAALSGRRSAARVCAEPDAGARAARGRDQ